MKLNATQKNLLTAAGLGALATTPAFAVASLGVLAQPIVAATAFTKGRKLPARIAQGAIGAALGLVSFGIGACFNPEVAVDTQPTETKVEIVKEAPAPKAEVVKEAPAPRAEVAPAPAKKTYKYTAEEAKYQFSFFYNLGRKLGPGHLDTSYNAEQQLRSNGFPPVDVRFIKTVRECYDNTGDAYCWDR